MPDAKDMPLVALKSKTGELEALSQTRASVIPMVELLDSLPADERRQVIRDLVMCVAERARARQPTWIDISWLSAASELAAFPHGVFHELERRIDNALGLDSQIIDAPRFVPVVPISVSERSSQGSGYCGNLASLSSASEPSQRATATLYDLSPASGQSPWPPVCRSPPSMSSLTSCTSSAPMRKPSWASSP